MQKEKKGVDETNINRFLKEHSVLVVSLILAAVVFSVFITQNNSLDKVTGEATKAVSGGTSGSTGGCLCNDSDNGQNFLLKGTATRDTTSKTDYCTGRFWLREYYCDNTDNINQVDYNCDSIRMLCINGACTLSYSCSDPDGLDPTQKSTARDISGSFTDWCVSDKNVTEYYCDKYNIVRDQNIGCAANERCVDGACIVATCTETDGGNEPLVKGTTTDNSNSSTDFCLSTNKLREYWCDGVVKTYNDYDCLNPCVDGACNVWSGSKIAVTGMSREPRSSNSNYFTIAYDSVTGKELWNKTYDGGGNLEEAYSTTIDDNKDVYITGFTDKGTTYAYLTVKYDKQGKELWNKIFDDIRNDQARGVTYIPKYTTQQLPLLLVSGNSIQDKNGTIDSDYLTIIYNSTNGKEIWKTVDWLTGTEGPLDNTYGVDYSSTSKSRYVFVTGFKDYGNDGIDYHTIAYYVQNNDNMVLIWRARSGLNGTNKEDVAHGVAYQYILTNPPTKRVIVTGSSVREKNDTAKTTNRDYYTVMYNAIDGKKIYEVLYDGNRTIGDDIAYDVAIDSKSNIIVTGTSGGDYYTIKYHMSLGNVIWSKRYDSGGYDEAHGVSVDKNDNIYVTGKRPNGITGDDYLTIKYDPNGNELWQKRYDGGGVDIAYADASDR